MARELAERPSLARGPSSGRKTNALLAAQVELRSFLFMDALGSKREVAAELARLSELDQIFTSAGDERSLGRTAYLRAKLYWDSFRLGDAEKALGVALQHARGSESHHDVARALEALTEMLLLGPHPVADAIGRCEEIVGWSEGNPLLESKSLLRLAGLTAMKEDFATARTMIDRSRAILHEIRHRYAGALSTHEAGMVEVLAGRSDAADSEFRAGIAALEIMGDGAALASSASYLAGVLYTKGQLEDALHWTEASEAAWGDHPYGICEWGPTRAKVQARFGHVEVAEHLARAALRPIQSSDDVLARANATTALAEVLGRAGKYTAATRYLEEAAGLYHSKGVVPLERMVRRALASRAA